MHKWHTLTVDYMMVGAYVSPMPSIFLFTMIVIDLPCVFFI